MWLPLIEHFPLSIFFFLGRFLLTNTHDSFWKVSLAFMIVASNLKHISKYDIEINLIHQIAYYFVSGTCYVKIYS